MFPLHETTQRRVCRGLFLALGVVPLVAVLAGIVISHRPWRERDWQQSLAQQLHVRAEVSEVGSPRPGVVELAEVQLANLTSGARLAMLSQIESQRWGGIRRLEVDKLVVPAAELSAVAQAIAVWMSNEACEPLQLHANSIEVNRQDGTTWQRADVTLRVEKNVTGKSMFVLNSDPIRLKVECESLAAGWQWHSTLRADDDGLPGWLLADFMPGMPRTAGTVFTGNLQAEFDGKQSSGALSGTIAPIACDELLGTSTRRRWQATAHVQLDRLRWEEGRIATAEGTFSTGPGVMGRSFVGQLQQRLLCQAAALPAGEAIPYDELACRFQIAGALLQLTGQCRTHAAGGVGCLASHQGRVLLSEPRFDARSVSLHLGQLVQVFFADQNLSWLPASREANEMANHLPLPSGQTQQK